MQPSSWPPPIQEFSPAPEPVREALKPGEQVIWWSQPDAGMVAQSGSWLGFIGTAILLSSFALVRQFSHQISFAGHLLIYLVMVPVEWFFVLAPVRLSNKARRTWFAITSQRLLICIRARRPKVVTITASEMGAITRTELRGGLGTITIAGAGQPTANKTHFKIIGVQDAERVEELLRVLKAR